jgi:LytS/YehU family sensor histidine kinase
MRLSALLRSVLRSAPEFSTLGEELRIVTAYLEIENARFEDRLTVRIDVGESLRNLRIPTLLLQPLVENAIKHGISKTIAGGEVRIEANLKESILCVIVEDTGSGGDDLQFALGRTQGVGLNSVEKRLQCYGQNAASMKITSKPGEGTRIEVRMPAESSSNAEDREMATTSKDKPR